MLSRETGSDKKAVEGATFDRIALLTPAAQVDTTSCITDNTVFKV
jgi:hypothetical protein